MLPLTSAVAVVSETGRVGYLPRDQAQSFGRTLQLLQQLGYKGGSCTGLLNGGDAERPSLGIVLKGELSRGPRGSRPPMR